MTDKNILLLQGPMGPFFKRFAKELAQNNKKVVKVNFNAGDWIFFPNGRRYKGGYRDWTDYLKQLIYDETIDQVFLFGDQRPYHRIAIDEVLNPLNIDVYVFEEGYLRPSFITLEKNGVNGNSEMPKTARSYQKKQFVEETKQKAIKGQFFKSMLFSVIYGLAKSIGRVFFRKYNHHRCLKPFKQGRQWLWGWIVRKPYYYFDERKDHQSLVAHFKKRYFFVPLQVHNDFQIKHSPYESVNDFIKEVVCSFAQNAPSNTLLVFKHHPMDRPYTNYKKMLQQLAKDYSLQGRIIYLHDQYLPALLQNALGTVVINSTVGLSSLYHSIPVLVKGTAVYDVAGLTNQHSLDKFWRHQGEVNKVLYKKYRLFLLNYNQGYGSFYQKGVVDSPTGICWPAQMKMLHSVAPLNEKEVIAPRLNRPSIVQVISSSTD
ncbi:MAG: capsular biosynthesis protein [Cocleimonas sp.]|nr:capsular biosynthesis protein [Cocleimonas sp.]